ESGPDFTPLPVSTISKLSDDALHKECGAARGQSDVSLYLGLDRNIQYTGGPLSTLRCSLPFGFLRLSLFSHVTAPLISFQPRQSTVNRQRRPVPMQAVRCRA